MKLQIITKLQQYEPSKLDLTRALKLDGIDPYPRQESVKRNRQDNQIICCERNEEKIKKFFINFNNETMIKHEKVKYLPQGPKRRLQ